MLPIEWHPAIVHFPIALGVVGALAAVTSLIVRREWIRWFAPVLLSIALLGGVAAYFSGQNAEDAAERAGVPEEPLSSHEDSSLYGLGLLALATVLAWATTARRRGEWVAALVAVGAAGAILYTAYLGGQLVFVHGAGRATPPTTHAP
jgi:uncharacterized membrane protein